MPRGVAQRHGPAPSDCLRNVWRTRNAGAARAAVRGAELHTGEAYERAGGSSAGAARQCGRHNLSSFVGADRQHHGQGWRTAARRGTAATSPAGSHGTSESQADTGGEGQPLLSKGPKARAADGGGDEAVTGVSTAKIRALVDAQVARRTENPANFHQATANFVLAGDTRLVKPLTAPPENVSRFSTAGDGSCVGGG